MGTALAAWLDRAQILTYDYQFHGGPTGNLDQRAIVRPYGADRVTIAYVHFVLAGKPMAPNKQADHGLGRRVRPSAHARTAAHPQRGDFTDG